MISERIILNEDRVFAEGVNKQKYDTAENMMRNNEPAEKIKQYTGLTLDALYELSKKLGISLVL